MSSFTSPTRRQLLRHSAAWLGAPALLGLAGCAGAPVFEAPPASVAIAALKAGQQLRFKVSNLYNGLAVGTANYTADAVAANGSQRIAVSLPSSNVSAQDDAQRTGTLLLTDRFHASEELFFDVPYTFGRPDRLLPERLALGASPVLENSYRRGDEYRTMRWATRVSGEGWERITVPAGTFLTLRVQRSIWFDHPDAGWRRSNMRTDTLWFAPTLGFWVRREWTGEYLVPDVRRDLRKEDWVRFELI
jgi:hypothetical protein